MSRLRSRIKPAWRSRLAIIGVVLLAALLRGWAVWQLPVDFDEPVYLQAASDYAAAIRAGDLNGIIDYAGNPEHPPLVKLMYAAADIALGPDAPWNDVLTAARGTSAFFGTAAVLLLAFVSPLAAGLLALDTMVVKYTSQAYLEALPLFAMLAAILALVRSRRRRDAWFWLSAVALGLTAAGKYAYFPVVFVILYLLIWEKKRSWQDILIYFSVTIAAFWLLDPALWHDPVSRLVNSLTFHIGYSQGAHVQEVGYPWYQPFIWISTSAAWNWHPSVFFYPGFDELIFIGSLVGAYWEWRERRWVAVWIVAGLLFLLLWPTKWPQYTLVLIPALCLSAASGVRHAVGWFREQMDIWPWIRDLVPSPSKAFWLALLVVSVFFLSIYASNVVTGIAGRRGWTHLTPDNSPLPSLTVNDVAALPDERMLLATENGAAIRQAAPASDLPDTWTLFTTQNSGLPDNRVHEVLSDSEGHLWFGTEGGLAEYDGTQWRTFGEAEMGLSGHRIEALAQSSNGNLWVGTDAGAAVFDGTMWTAYTSATSGLLNDFIFAIAAPAGDMVWFGTLDGVSRLDTRLDQWQQFTPENSGLGDGGVAALMVDSDGGVWAGTLGGGLSGWDGTAWRSLYTGNSGLPFNTVPDVYEASDGVLWIATAFPNNAGGVLASLDGSRWKTYAPLSTGYSGAEIAAIAEDQMGRLWFGTLTAGVDLYAQR